MVFRWAAWRIVPDVCRGLMEYHTDGSTIQTYICVGARVWAREMTSARDMTTCVMWAIRLWWDAPWEDAQDTDSSYVLSIQESEFHLFISCLQRKQILAHTHILYSNDYIYAPRVHSRCQWFMYDASTHTQTHISFHQQPTTTAMTTKTNILNPPRREHRVAHRVPRALSEHRDLNGNSFDRWSPRYNMYIVYTPKNKQMSIRDWWSSRYFPWWVKFKDVNLDPVLK